VNWLDEIIARKRSDIAKMHAEEFRSRAERRDDFRDFHAAIRRRSGRVRVIAEAKSASPSAGVIAANYDPVGIAMRYKENGATRSQC
jgi:Indole-3-glycerol phosphate synthase